jgi:hypothetical protein
MMHGGNLISGYRFYTASLFISVLFKDSVNWQYCLSATFLFIFFTCRMYPLLLRSSHSVTGPLHDPLHAGCNYSYSAVDRVDVGLGNDDGSPASPLRVSGHCSQPACYRTVMIQVDFSWHLVTRRVINGRLKI